MFTDHPFFSTFAVRDLDAARAFYGETLGLDVADDPMGMLLVRGADGSTVTVYPKPDHEPAVFTVLNFPVADLELAVDALIVNGVEMEHYDNEWMTTDAKGILRDERGPAIAWFRDPSGNILSVIEERG